MTEIPAVVLPPETKRVVVVLIQPSSWDSKGNLYTFYRGVVPTSTLLTMRLLTETALESLVGSAVPVEVHAFEEGVAWHYAATEKLLHRFSKGEPGTVLILGVVGVQTSQFPRASAIISRWQKECGAICMIGGPHVTGSIATMLHGINDGASCPHTMPSEIQSLMDAGVIVFAGEAERLYGQVLSDILTGCPQNLYEGGNPDIAQEPLAYYPPEGCSTHARRMVAFQGCRGCPFDCDFCAVRTIYGQKMRARNPDVVLGTVKEMLRCEGRADFFFTDDNFARNPHREAILAGLIALRQQGHKISFMIQADLAIHKMPKFLPMLAEAGCSQIFFGVESVRPENLAGVGKKQNNVEAYSNLFVACHEQGIIVHAGYIIGFPGDTLESIQEDMALLKKIGIDQLTLFMMTPLPGSRDHFQLAMTNPSSMNPDLNWRNAFQPSSEHPLMSPEQWTEAFKGAWKQFYCDKQNMSEVLKRFSGHKRWDVLKLLIWILWSITVEDTHPMVAGLIRIKPWSARRDSAPALSRGRFYLQEASRFLRYGGCFLSSFFFWQGIVFAVEFGPYVTAKREVLDARLHGIGDWLYRTFGPVANRRWLNAFWVAYGRKRWQLLINPLVWPWHLRMLPRALTEAVYALRFGVMALRLLS